MDLLRGSHIKPIVDQWDLVLVGLAMVRDSAESRVWESSFIAVNMHPENRLGIEDWLKKIHADVTVASKFETEDLDDLKALRPAIWTKYAQEIRTDWLQTIKDGNASWDVDMIENLREDGMPLELVSQMFKIFQLEQRIAEQIRLAPAKPAPAKPVAMPKRSSMIYHMYNPDLSGMTPLQRFQHMVTVRDRTMGAAAIKPSPHLNLEISDDNRRFLAVTPDNINMFRVLQESTCRHGQRRRVSKRTLNALGYASGMCGRLNDPKRREEIESSLKFVDSVEQVRFKQKQQAKAKTVEKKKQKALKLLEKEEKARKKFQEAEEGVLLVRDKLGLSVNDVISACHVDRLTGKEINSVAYIMCKGIVLKDRVAERREELKQLLLQQEPTAWQTEPVNESVESVEFESEETVC